MITFHADNRIFPYRMRPLLAVGLLACWPASAVWGQLIDQARVFPADGWEFGNALAPTGNTLAVGDAFLNGNPSRATLGNAYVFARTNGQWAEQAELKARDGKTNRRRVGKTPGFVDRVFNPWSKPESGVN